MGAKLKVLSGPDAGAAFDLAEDFLIGRDGANHLALRDGAASRHHLRIQRSDDFYLLRDLGSHNGTRVNGADIREHVLAHGDRIQIGRTLFEFQFPEAAGTAAGMIETSTLTVRAERAGAELPPVYERLRKLYDLAALLTGELDPAALVPKILEAALAALDADVAALVRPAAEPTIATRKPGGPLPGLPNSILRTVLREGKSLLLAPGEETRSPSVVRERILTAVSAPLLKGGRPIGALYADRRSKEEPFRDEDLDFLTAMAHQAAAALGNAIVFARTQAKVRELERELGYGDDLVGKAAAWRSALELALKLAASDAPVLLLGASGTGKELVARLIHQRGARAKGPFVAINCASLIETLLESELFGHEKGAFTGAYRARPGKFDAADGGTLFLDEIGDMSSSVQAKLLRALQERTYYRVGGTDPVQVNVRIVAATNRNLEALVKEGKFREDLYYRIRVLSITLPPLRDRKEDIPLLAYHFLERFARQMKKPVGSISSEALDLLVQHDWPGNVRELQNLLERATVLCDGPTVLPEHLPAELRGPREALPGEPPLNLHDAERWCIVKALERTSFKKGEALKILGISWPTLNRKLAEYGIEKRDAP